MQIVPPSRPQQQRLLTEARLRAAGLSLENYPVAILGVRGYYLDTMGKPGANDRKMYDDAVFLLSPRTHLAFNANCDPGAFRKGIANLTPGIWYYKIGIHGWSKPASRRYKAFVQAAPVTVHRDDWAKPVTGFFGINIHRGSRLSVSSLGCQTIWPGQWSQLIEEAETELRFYRQSIIPYVLIEESR